MFGGISTPFGGTPSPSSGELRHLISLSSFLLFSFFSDFLFLCCHFLRHKKRERGIQTDTRREREVGGCGQVAAYEPQLDDGLHKRTADRSNEVKAILQF